MSRSFLVAGNWKMHGTIAFAGELVRGIQALLPRSLSVEVVVIPAFPHLYSVQQLLQGSTIRLGAQNLSDAAGGAFTGEVSASMLQDIGCHYVLVGHSERRQLFHEDAKLVGLKAKAACATGLTPIICVGETALEREEGRTEPVIAAQLQAVLSVLLPPEALCKTVIAYEPVWAIGTGLTATPEQAEAVHAFIRHWLMQNHVAEAATMRILYGGSVKPENAEALFAMPNIDGGLIGGASLDAVSFTSICKSAEAASLSVKMN